MKSALLAAAVLALPMFADAGPKYVVRNGRAVTGGGGGGHSGGGSAAPSAPAVAMRSSGGSPVYSGGGGQAFVGGGARRSSGGHHSFYGGNRLMSQRAYRVPQRALEGGGSGEAPAEPTTEEAPPHFSKPGALIRTEGHRRFEYAEPSSPARTTGVEAGEIALNSGKAYHVNRSHGLRVGAPDTLPGRNPSGGSSGNNGVTPNSTIVYEGDVRHNGAHDNQNGGGNGNGRGNGNGNGNGFGGGTGFDPSF